MSMMADHSQRSKKIADACNAVAHFGFPEERVKTTVRRLVGLYNNEWKFIEEDNYRELIDILMKETSEGAEVEFRNGDATSKGKSVEVKPGLKRCLRGQHDCSSSSVVNIPNKRAKTDVTASLAKAKIAALPLPDARGKRSIFEKSEPVENRAEGVSNFSQIDIASSSGEKVKISLICESHGDSIVRNKNLDAVLAEVEGDCCRTYGIQDPDFSLIKLMRKVCDRFVEMDTYSVNNAKSSCEGGYTFEPSQMNGLPSHQGVVEVVDDASEKKIKFKDPQSSSVISMEAVLQKKYPIYLNDISRGEESVPIPLVDENSGLELPDFIYIKCNMVHKAAHVDFSLARISDDNCCALCHGDCLSSALPCACAGETGGEFAYAQGGLLKEEFLNECISLSRDPDRKHCYYCEVCPLQNDLRKKNRRIKPCKGHLTRKFIKECWSKCGCNKTCGNRIVQRGIKADLQVFAAPGGKGWGIQSVHALQKGTFVCEYVGEIVSNQELDERNKERDAKQEKHTYPVLLDADWGSERILKDEEALCLDATEFGNVGRFVNHRCEDANLIEIPVEVETPDHHYYRLAFFTSRDIEPMEELTWDYGIEFKDKSHPIKAFKCKCGSSHCRDKKKTGH